MWNESGQAMAVPRYVYTGPEGGGDRIRIGIFATIHGDEPEAVAGLARFIEQVESNPSIATGYCLFLYPVCNPTGYLDGTRTSRSVKDLNREFWKDSREPEVAYLESEIVAQDLAGIITLHGDDTSDGLYGFVRGAVLSRGLLEPALEKASEHLPINRLAQIDGFCASDGIITDCYHGVLQSPPGRVRPPFEIIFETPQRAPAELQARAHAAALEEILVRYRELMAFAQSI